MRVRRWLRHVAVLSAAVLLVAPRTSYGVLSAAVDSDGDNFADSIEPLLGSDPAKQSSAPESVATPPSCMNFSDDDGDGQTDLADPGCTGTAASKETFPASGVDVFDSTMQLDDYVFDAGQFGICPLDFQARGPVVVRRGDPVDLGGGLRRIDVEILAMQLTGLVVVGTAPGCDLPATDIDPVTVLEDPAQASTGQVNDLNSDPARDLPAQSFFDVFFQVESSLGLLAGGPPGGPAGGSVRVTNDIGTVPPYHGGNNPLCYQVPGLTHQHCPKAPPDHFACYRGKFPKGSKRQVTLRDQFDTEARQATVLKPAFFCNPAAKNGEPLYEETGHLECWKLKPNKQKRTVTIQNQFGTGQATTKKSVLLCLPSGKDTLGDPEQLDHFQCYTGKFAKLSPRPVTLVDQFGTLQTTVSKRLLLCNPVDKNGEGIGDRLNHLECFAIKPQKVSRTVTVRNQFGEHQVQIRKSAMLCAPSNKIDGIPTTTTTIAGGTTTTSTTLPIITEITGGYRHLGPGSSETCGKVTTSPPLPGGTGTVTMTRPDTSTATTDVTLNGQGAAVFAFPINQFGVYGLQAQIETPGEPSTAQTNVNVGPTQGTCPQL